MKNCSDHLNNPITLICIAQHNCQRRLCEDCQYKHGVKQNLLFPLNNVKDYIKSRIQDLLIQYDQQLSNIDVEIRPLITQFEIENNEIKMHLREFLQNAQDMIKGQDKIFSRFMISVGNPQNISKIEIDQIVETLQGNNLQKLINKKHAFITQLQFINGWLNKQVKRLKEILKEEISDLQINSKIEQQGQIINQKETKSIQEYEGFTFDEKTLKFIQTKYLISQTNILMEYMTSDRQILRIDQIKNISNKPQIFLNLEQIKHLQWQGSYRDQYQKFGKWIAIWKDQILNSVGGFYSNNEKKIGIWKELIQNYCSQAQVFKIGEYQNDRKYGHWMYIYRDINIGGGYYNSLGQKSGCWRILSKNFWNQSQVFYQGYYENGKKVSKWDIIWKIPQGINNFQQVGGGLFDQNNMKNGIWVELSDGFSDYNQSIYEGQYQNGNKVGRWISSWRNPYETNEFELIGGGSFDKYSIKAGTWIELSDNFNIENQVIYIGNYKNGRKVGKWNIKWRLDKIQPFLLIGGGMYSENNFKNGKWIELSQNHENQNQCIINCEYIEGKYFGLSSIFWREYGNEPFKYIGGGIFDLQNYKNGRWIEISDNFKIDNQIIYCGQYKNGKKVTRWDELKRDFEKMKNGFIKIGENFFYFNH